MFVYFSFFPKLTIRYVWLCKIYRYVKYTDMWNVHMHRNPETLETLTTLGSSGTKLLLPSWLLGFQHEERERDTISTSLTVPSDPTTCSASRRPNWPGLDEAWKSTRFAQVRISTTCFFSKITQNPQPIASGHDVIHIPSHISYPGFLLWHLWLSHPPRASVNTWTWTMCAPTRALSRIVLSLTKPNDKIYPTKNDNMKKSFRNYITLPLLLWIANANSSFLPLFIDLVF